MTRTLTHKLTNPNKQTLNPGVTRERARESERERERQRETARDRKSQREPERDRESQRATERDREITSRRHGLTSSTLSLSLSQPLNETKQVVCYRALKKGHNRPGAQPGCLVFRVVVVVVVVQSCCCCCCCCSELLLLLFRLLLLLL